MPTTRRPTARFDGWQLVRALCVPPNKARDIWPFVGEMLLRSVRKTGLASDDDLRKSIMDGRALIWIAEEDKAIKGAAVTEIYDTGAAVRCNILALSGAGFDEWSHLGSVIEDYARENGCTTLALVGRKGWARKLRNKGFVLTNVVMERRL